jgi:hypothetical protein
MFRFTGFVLMFAVGCEGPLFSECITEGDGYDVKAMQPGPCCDGLTAANTTEAPDEAGVCQVLDINPSKVCIACGDGACGTSENECNCPADCG